MGKIDLRQYRDKKQAKKMCEECGTSIKEVVLENIETIIKELRNISHKIENSEPCVNEDWVKVAAPLNEMMNVLGNHWYIDE